METEFVDYHFMDGVPKEDLGKPLREMQKIKTLNDKLSGKYKDISLLSDVKDEWGRLIRTESGNYFQLFVSYIKKNNTLHVMLYFGEKINGLYMGSLVLPGLDKDVKTLDRLIRRFFERELDAEDLNRMLREKEDPFDEGHHNPPANPPDNGGRGQFIGDCMDADY